MVGEVWRDAGIVDSACQDAEPYVEALQLQNSAHDDHLPLMSYDCGAEAS